MKYNSKDKKKERKTCLYFVSKRERERERMIYRSEGVRERENEREKVS